MVLKRLIVFLAVFSVSADIKIHVNQVAYEQYGPKTAVVDLGGSVGVSDSFYVFADGQTSVAFSGKAGDAKLVTGWTGGAYAVCNFSNFHGIGKFVISYGGKNSVPFKIAKNALVGETLKDAVAFFTGMRNKEDDSSIPFFGGTDTRNVNGGWSDATGDRGKYLSHLSYANFFSPQQIPLVVWSLLKTSELTLPAASQMQAALNDEAAWGADYLYRILDTAGYFYLTVFDRWGWDEKREICAWYYDPYEPQDYLKNGKKSKDYQAAFREGGGVSIAALARAARMKISGVVTSADYLSAAKRAYAHLKINNKNYCDDKSENIIDDYCALLASVELYRATSDMTYFTDATSRAAALLGRVSESGFFWSDSARIRPFYHAADEGLPIVALLEYQEIAPAASALVKAAIQKIFEGYSAWSFVDYNPFEYLKLAFSQTAPNGVSGANLALKKPVTVSQVQEGFPAANCNDGMATSRWASGQPYSDTEWVVIDLENEFEISSVACLWENAYGKQYDIMISKDNTNWTKAVSVTNEAPGRVLTSFEPVTGRYVKMQGVKRGIEYGYSLYEFEVYGRKKVVAQPVQSAYFIPHENETGYWWQGEDARLASLSSAVFLSLKAGIPLPGSIVSAATSQVDWILGKNPFDVCMMYGFGVTNYPDYPGKPGYTLVNLKGGICNGITADTTGKDSPQWKPYKDENTENWRWIEQWLPHNAWYILAVGSQSAIDWQTRNPVRKMTLKTAPVLELRYRLDGASMRVMTPWKTDGEIVLRSISGKTIIKKEFSVNERMVSLKTSGLSTGIYMICMETGTVKLTSKVFIKR